MNKNIATTPSLSFKEALCKAWSNLTNLKGRSRRSEFWWFMLVFYIALQIVSGILTCFSPNSHQPSSRAFSWASPLP